MPMIGSIVIPVDIVFIESTIRSQAYVRKREASNRDRRAGITYRDLPS